MVRKQKIGQQGTEKKETETVVAVSRGGGRSPTLKEVPGALGEKKKPTARSNKQETNTGADKDERPGGKKEKNAQTGDLCTPFFMQKHILTFYPGKFGSTKDLTGKKATGR